VAGRHRHDTGRTPFLRLYVIDMANELDVEAGVPVALPVIGDDPVFAGILPAGRYVDYVHVGHPDGLVKATAAVLAWADTAGPKLDMRPIPNGNAWGCRLMVFLTNPADEPDPNNWKTELLFRIAG
jgi:GyrI-like small molecule binding protein